VKRRRRRSLAERAFPIVAALLALVLVLSLIAQTCAPAVTTAPGV